MNNRTNIMEVNLKSIDDEPRARDLDIADRLGFARPRDIRKLIERNRSEFDALGTCATVAHVVRGNPVKEYWLNEEQSLLAASLSDADRAPEVRRMLIKVFVAWRRGELPEVKKAPVDRTARETRLFMQSAMKLAAMAGLNGNQRLIAANRATRRAVGFDYMQEMGVSYLEAPQNDVLLNATTIGKELGGISAIKVNQLLSEHGYQAGVTDNKGRPHWIPTAKGEAAGGVMTEVERSNETGMARQLRWASSIIDELKPILKGGAA